MITPSVTGLPIKTQNDGSCTAPSTLGPQHSHPPLMRLQDEQDRTGQKGNVFGPKLNGAARVEPMIGEIVRLGTLHAFTDEIIPDQQKLSDWIEKNFTPNKAKQILSSIGVGWFNEFHLDPGICENGQIKLDRGFFHTKKTVWCRHLSLAYVLDRENFLQAAQNKDTLQAYAQQKRSESFSEAVWKNFDNGKGVVISKDEFGMLVCSLFAQMERESRSEYAAALTTRAQNNKSGHGTAVHLQIKDGIPPIYCVHCYDPNKTGTELTYELTREQLRERFNSHLADYKSFFHDFYRDNLTMSVMSRPEDAKLLRDARPENMIFIPLPNPGKPGREYSTSMIAGALQRHDTLYLKKYAGKLAVEVKKWTRDEKRALLNDLRDIHGFRYFFFRPNFHWYDQLRSTHPDVYRIFKEIKNTLRQG